MPLDPTFTPRTKTKKKPVPPAPVGGTFTPTGFVPNKPKTQPPPDRAPYRHGQSPEQRVYTRTHPAPTPEPRVTRTRSTTRVASPRTAEAGAQDHAQALALQRFLNSHGYHLAEDGIIGPQTYAAYQEYTRKWQAREHVAREKANADAFDRAINPFHDAFTPHTAPKLSQREFERVALTGRYDTQTLSDYAQQHGLKLPAPLLYQPTLRNTARAEAAPHYTNTKRYAPHYEGEPVAGYIGALKNLDGTYAMPGTRAKPGAYVSERPYYTDQYTAAHNDPSAFEQLSPEQQKIWRENHPLGQQIIQGVAEAIPGVALAQHFSGTGHASLSDAIGSDVLNTLGFLGPAEIMAPLKIARAVRDSEGIVNAYRLARATRIETAADRALVKQASFSEARARYAKTLKDAGYGRKAQKNLLDLHDKAAIAYAHAHDITPEAAWDRIYAHSQYNDVHVTKDDLATGRVVFAQTGAQPEVENLAGTPTEHIADPSILKNASRRLVRAHKAALPAEYNTPAKLHGLLEELRQRALDASDYRKWYENSANAILHYMQGNVEEADKLAALIAVYSPRAEVYSTKTEWNNLDRAINAYHDYQEQGVISPKWSISSHKTGEGDWQTFRAQQIMQGNFEWEGLKTNRFYRNFLQHIDPEKYAAQFGTEKFGTIDTWMRRAFKYPKQYRETGDVNLFGEAVKTGKAQEQITPAMYRFMEQANKIVADSLGWSPEEAQAAIWTSVKAEAEGTPHATAGFDFSHGFEHREVRKAAPLATDQLALDTATADQPLRSAVDDAIEASRAPDSGFTLTASLRPDAPRPGHGRFIVAYGAYEARQKAPLEAERLLQFRNEHLARLQADPSLRIGGWHNPEDGQVYLDLSKTFDTEEEAMQFAREQGQLAIFDRENPDASLPTGLSASQADEIKAGLREHERLQSQATRYEQVLADAHVAMGGKTTKAGTLTKSDRKAVEQALFEIASKHPNDPWVKEFENLQWEATMAGNAPEPEVLFQADPLVQQVADAQGLKDTRAKALDAYRGTDLQGLPKSRASNKVAQQVARDYMDEAGLTYHPPTTYEKVNPDRAERIAQWYDNAVSAPEDEAVRRSYDAMIRETKAQYDAIVQAGYRFEFYPPHDPYPSGPSAAIDDLRSNQHMYVFPTSEGFGSLTEAERAHPLLADSGVRWNGQEVTHNDLFRAVHDYFGHFKEGVGFRADGEENAWRSHVAMYSEEARPAMTAETRGQNSWVNYGPHGEANKTADQAATVYADQKAVIAPEWAIREGSGAPNPVIKGAVHRLTSGEHILHLFQGADITTAIHEFGHALETMIPAASRKALADAGVKTEEQFARSFERYFYEGEAKAGTESAMRDFAIEMSRVYRRAEDIPDALASPEIRDQFDSFFQREGRGDDDVLRAAANQWFNQESSARENGYTFSDEHRPSAETYHHRGAKVPISHFNKQSEGEPFHIHAYDAQGNLVGARHGFDMGDHVKLVSTYVAPEHRGQGINAEFSRLIRNHAGERPISSVFMNKGLGKSEAARSLAEGRTTYSNPRTLETFFQEGGQEIPEDELRKLDPAGERGAYNPVSDLTPEQQVREGLKGARSRYGQQKVQRHEEARRRSEEVEKALRSIADPDEAMAAASAAMKGEMPKIELNGVIREIDGPTLRELKTIVNQHESLLPFQKVRLNKALDSAVTDGRIPTPAEMRLIEHVFGKQTAVAVAQHAKGYGDLLLNVLNIPRTLMATLDLSAALRQGLVAGTTHPIMWGKSWPTMIRAMKSADFYEKATQAIKDDPLYNLALAAHVSFTDLGEGAGIAAHEEMFASDIAANLLDKVPIPNAIKGSARAYTAFLNKMRMDLFKHQIRVALAAGRDVQNEEFLKSLGDIVNAATGRGTIHGRLEHFLPAMNTLMFSPRLMLSRLNYLDPTWYYRLGHGLPKGEARQIRLEALKGLFATAGAVSGTLALFAQIPGVDVELDPRSSDFGKLRVGNTRLDIAGGFQQYVRLAAELITGEKKSTSTGQITKLGSGFGVPTRADEIQNFLWNKAAPPVAIGHEIIKGKDAVGNPVTPLSILEQNFTPLVLQDANDIRKEHNGTGMAWALGGYGLGALGVGLQTYPPKDVAKKPTDKLTQAAKDAGAPPPSHEILIDLKHKANLDSLSQQHKGDVQGRLAAYYDYYKQVTGRDDLAPYLRSAEGNDDMAEKLALYIRHALVGEGLSTYERQVKIYARLHGGSK